MIEDRRGAFEREALPWLDTVYRVALSLAGEPARADDLVQETMLKAWRSWDTFRPGTNVRAWLLRILRNAAIDEVRRRPPGRTVELTDVEVGPSFEALRDRDPEGRYFFDRVSDQVVGAIRSLPAPYREALILTDIADLGYAEVAEVLRVPVGTVKSRVFRARQALQRRLYDYALEMGYIRPRTPFARIMA